ncbi:MAG: Photosystem I reaction center subunit IX [Cyanobacteria bacterium J06639_1]
MDSGLQKFLSSAPVLAVVFSTFFVGLFIEINRFFPDLLVAF